MALPEGVLRLHRLLRRPPPLKKHGGHVSGREAKADVQWVFLVSTFLWVLLLFEDTLGGLVLRLTQTHPFV